MVVQLLHQVVKVEEEDLLHHDQEAKVVGVVDLLRCCRGRALVVEAVEQRMMRMEVVGLVVHFEVVVVEVRVQRCLEMVAEEVQILVRVVEVVEQGHAKAGEVERLVDGCH